MVLVQKAFYGAGLGCRLSVKIMFEGATFYGAAGVVNRTWGATSEVQVKKFFSLFSTNVFNDVN